MNDVQHIKQQLPVLIFVGNGHVMAKADVYRTADEMLIQIVATGDTVQFLAEFLEQAEPIGLSFSPVPDQNKREKREIP